MKVIVNVSMVRFLELLDKRFKSIDQLKFLFLAIIEQVNPN